MTKTVFNIFVSISFCVTVITADYWSDREKFIQSDAGLIVGSSLNLTEDEQKANDILMRHKDAEYDRGFDDPETFLPAKHFFTTRSQIDQSPVYNIIKKLPKGASLHSHDTAIASEDVVMNLTYTSNLYGCSFNGTYILRFFKENNSTSECNWALLSALREKNPNFDQFLYSAFSLNVEDPANFYPTENSVWTAFSNIFKSVFNFITYKPVWSEYFYQALVELYEDNVKYLEFRTVLPQIYDLDGHTYSDVEVVKLYYDTLQEFKKNYPDFLGAKMIYAPSRKINATIFQHYIDAFIKIREAYPDFIAGFDLVGQEDLGKPLIDFIPQLLKLQELGVKFFFHAGETNWFGTSTDQNLFDAVLLNTTRIGHGYAIIKHPKVAEEIKRKKIAVEISPISNQVLKLVDDMRNHPGNILIANNFPVVITCDDPSFWGAKALSYDWYMAFMGMTSRETGLKFLKQLAMNSILYSSMEDHERMLAFTQWNNDWNKFIDNLLVENNVI